MFETAFVSAACPWTTESTRLAVVAAIPFLLAMIKTRVPSLDVVFGVEASAVVRLRRIAVVGCE